MCVYVCLKTGAVLGVCVCVCVCVPLTGAVPGVCWPLTGAVPGELDQVCVGL